MLLVVIKRSFKVEMIFTTFPMNFPYGMENVFPKGNTIRNQSFTNEAQRIQRRITFDGFILLK